MLSSDRHFHGLLDYPINSGGYLLCSIRPFALELHWTNVVQRRMHPCSVRTAPLLPMRPGQIERRTHDYARHGTTTLFAALDTKTGKLIGQTQARHRSVEFRKFLDTIEQNVPQQLEVHLILDNYGTHKTQLIQSWLVKRPRFHLHFTPTSASWLNLVERWFAQLTDKQLRRGVHRSTKELESAIKSYIQHHNKDPKPFVWHKTAGQILDSVARFCTRTLDSEH